MSLGCFLGCLGGRLHACVLLSQVAGSNHFIKALYLLPLPTRFQSSIVCHSLREQAGAGMHSSLTVACSNA